MRPALSIISCASGRLPLFVRHLDSLARQDAACRCEYSVGTWGEDAEHRRELLALEHRFAAVRVERVETDRWWPLPLAYNAALSLASSERLLIVGSDIVVDENLLAWAAERAEEDVAWCFRVVRENGSEVIGPRRRLAIPFCMAVAKAPVLKMGGWDTAFCDSPCYDDNDFAARLLLAGVFFRWSDGFANVHLSHERYGGNDRRGRSQRNEALWRRRIGGRSGSLWPLQGDGGLPTGVQGDGFEEQAKVRQELIEWDYPARGNS